MLTAVVGINWGDEGKGRMIDLLAGQYDIICRYQGGNNAGHTVVNDKGKFVLNLLPSGILRDNTINIMGAGMVIDIGHLCEEIKGLEKKGISINPDKLKISGKAFISMPFHSQQDIWEEERLGDSKYGSTRRGIAPAYGDKYMKKGLRMGDLLEDKTLGQKLVSLVEWKNLVLKGYEPQMGKIGTIDADVIMDWLEGHGRFLSPFITDTTNFLANAVNEGKNILFEAQLGALRDIDYGIYPFTTSSHTLAAYATTGAGIPGLKLDGIIGIMKAYSSCVGEGPFTAELYGNEANDLREAGNEYGAATGRPRRVGGFDVVASRYGVRMQGANQLALTKLDVLSYMEMIPICTSYEIDGKKTLDFPSGDALTRAKPVYEYMEGFRADISTCKKMADLPIAAAKYIQFIEDAVGCPISYVSVGPGRGDYFIR